MIVKEHRRIRRAMTAARRESGKLLDCATVAREYGITRAGAEAIMRQLPKVQIDGFRKVYVKRVDVEALIDSKTTAA